MAETRTQLGVITMFLGLAISATHCSSSSSQGSSLSGAAGSAPSGGGAKVRCDQLKAADVQALMTHMITSSSAMPLGTDNDGQQCFFDDADSEQAIEINVAPASDPVLNYDNAKASGKNLVPVSGIGDEAFRESHDFGPTAQHGGVMCTVTVSEADEIPGVSNLIVGGKLDLTEAQNAKIAAALGTICNRIFGVGNTTPDLSGL